MPKFKAQLHVHTKEDPADRLKLTAKQAIDKAANLGYDVVAITCHNVVIFNDDLKKYAEQRRILLIPGIEKSIKRKHVIILNATIDAQNIQDFDGLKEYKKNNPDCFIIAPHPYYPGGICLKKELEKNIELFDAIEYSWYHSKKINRFNKKALAAAEKHNLPVIGTSDNHLPRYFDKTYSIIESEKKEIPEILKAISQKRITYVSHPVPPLELAVIWLEYMANMFAKKVLLR